MDRKKFLIRSAMIPVFFTGPLFRDSNYKNNTISAANRIIREAHRGANMIYPENTIPAFEEAIRLGVDRIELDVRISTDGHLYVFHDEKLDRTTNTTGHVSELTLQELKNLDAGSWKSPEFKGLKIPSLREVFDLARGKCFINIDLKESAAAQPLVKLAKETGMENNIVVTGKVPECTESIREINNAITMFFEFPDDLPVSQPEKAVEQIRKQKLPGCLIHYKNANSKFISQCKLHGLSVSTWGVQDEKEILNLIALGVDSIMTDDILLLNKIINQITL